MTSPSATAPRPSKGGEQSFTAALQAATGEQTATRPYLGDYNSVESLVRALFAEELDRAVDKGAGELSDADYGQQSLAAVQRMARIFTGQDPRYSPMAGWNSPGPLPGKNLASTIAQRLAGQVAPTSLATPQLAAESLFSLAILEWREGLAAYGQSNDAEQLENLGNELSENYTRLLVGLPTEDDSDA